MQKIHKKITICGLFVFLILFNSGCLLRESEEKLSESVKISLFFETEAPVIYPLGENNVVAVRIKTEKAFCGFEYKVSLISDENQSVTLAVYPFITDYRTTLLESKAVLKEKFTDIKNGQWLFVKSEEIEAGEYLLVINEASDFVNIELHASIPSIAERAEFYYSGIRIDTGAFGCRIIYLRKTAKDLIAADLLSSLQLPVEAATE